MMKKRSTSTYVVIAVITAAVVASSVLGLLIVSSGKAADAPVDAPADARLVQPTAGAGVTEVLTWAETAKSRWTSIRVSGEVGLPGHSTSFVVEVSPEGSRSVEGDTTLAVSAGIHWYYNASQQRAQRWSEPSIDAETRQDLDRRMAEYAASDPTMMRPGERTIDGPLNDVINPAYWVRKELKHTAQSVTIVGVETISGRPAFHLRATFPPDLAKEDSWDVYVDQATGIILKFVINPLPGEDGYEQVVETVSIDPAFEIGSLDFSPPAGVEIETSAGQGR